MLKSSKKRSKDQTWIGQNRKNQCHYTLLTKNIPKIYQKYTKKVFILVEKDHLWMRIFPRGNNFYPVFFILTEVSKFSIGNKVKQTGPETSCLLRIKSFL